MPNAQLDRFIHALEAQAVPPLFVAILGAALLCLLFKRLEHTFIRVALFGIARFAIRKWSNAKRVPDPEPARNSGAAQIIQTVAARALSDRRQRSRLLQGYGGASLNSSQFAMSSSVSISQIAMSKPQIPRA